MTLPPGSRLGQYEIRASIGAGGMGEVYRAHDARLGRDVALKVLHPDVARDAVRLERFTREARAVAALTHPHIVTLYSTEEADGVRFMTMELVEGRPLDALIPQDGLPLPRFLELALQLADALTAAHQKQITHRDLKPGNVMVASDGRVKVLDFGLARFEGGAAEPALEATRSVLTSEGTLVGTVPYMSPEQIEGRHLDARSDLFSLGVMFYEMLCGARPFSGASSPALLSAILRDVPAPLTERRADAPEALARLVARCLEKRPEDRVQTARDVYNELRHVQRQIESSAAARQPGTAATRPRSGPGSVAARDRALAVVPFTAVTNDAGTQALADGLSEDVTAGLSRFSYLSVVAAHSARQHRGSTADARRLGQALGARYLLDGNARRAGATLRLTVRLVDTTTGAQLWSETCDRPAAEGDVLALQDDLTDRVVATVGDVSGVLLRAMSLGVEDLAPSQLDVDALTLRYWAYQRQHAPAEHALLREAFERVVGERPTLAFAWSALAHLYCHEHGFEFNRMPDPLGRARRALGRALEVDAVDQHGWEALALTYFFERDPEGFAHAAERAIALNPRNANALAMMGVLKVHTGDLDGGCALVERAMAINPDHPGWYHIAACNRHLVRGEFAEALRAAKRINMPQHLWPHVLAARAAGELGRATEAAGAIDALLAVAPGMEDIDTLTAATRRWKWDDTVVDQMMEGYRKALALREGSPGRSRPAPADRPGSGDARPDSTAADSSPRVAVLPFTARGGDVAAGLADGLTDDITTGLSRFPHLRVVPAGTAASLSTESAARAGVRYLIEGRVQGSGAAVRVTVRLIDGATGANLWANTFDRPLGSSTFEVQDDVASFVVATIGDTSGVLARSMAASVLQRPVDELTVRELTLRFHAYVEHFQAEEHARLRSGLERALEREPLVAEGWACLADLYEHEHSQRLNPLPDSLGRQRRAAQRAVEVDPHNQRGWTAMAAVHAFARDRAALRVAAERAISLNPLDADTVGLCALFLSCAGDDDRAMALYARAARLKPQHPGWYHFPPFTTHFKRQQYAEALAEAKRIAMPQLPAFHLSAAAAAARVGAVDEARAAIDALRQLDARFLEPEPARQAWALWLWDDALVQDLMDGLEEALALVGSSTSVTAGGASGSGTPVARPASGARPSSGTTATGAVTVSVQAFAPRGGGAATALADGLSEDIATGLARFSYLTVTTAAGAAFRVEGSVRAAGTSLRIATRLVETASGAHVWAEQFDRDGSDGALDLQDELAARIVTALADENGGVLLRTAAAGLGSRAVDDLTASELVLRFHVYAEQFLADEHAALRRGLEQAVEREPRHASAWACLSILYAHEAVLGLNPLPDIAGRQRRAADRALALDSMNQQVWTALAMGAAFTRDATGLRAACERVVSLNPLSAHGVATAAVFLVFAGDVDRAAALIRQVRAHTPHHQGWYNFVPFLEAYLAGDDDRALEHAKRIRMPVFSWCQLSAAAAAGQVGKVGEARAALESLRASHPHLLDPEAARQEWAAWFWQDAPVQRLVAGLEKALALAERAGPVTAPDALARPFVNASAASASSTAVGVGAAVPVAVQPFTARGDDPDAAELAHGLTDAVATRLSRFRYVRVRALAASDGPDAIRAAGVAYVLGASVRRSGQAFRVSARLTHVATGENAWAEQYDREASSATFVLLDDLSSAIVATLADGGGVFDRVLVAALKDAEPGSAGDLFARWAGYVEHFTAERHAALRAMLEAKVAEPPGDSMSWAVLSILYGHEIFFNFNPRPDPAPRVRHAAERAVTLDPDNQSAWYAMAEAEFFDRHAAAFHSAAERAIELNPLHSRTLGGLGIFYAYTGDTDRGAALVARAMTLNPRVPGWFHIVPFLDAYRRGDADAAFTHAARINMPHLPVSGRLFAIAAAGRFGREREARDGIRLVAESRPELLSTDAARREWGRWIWEGELLDTLVDGYEAALTVAGISVSPPDGAVAPRHASGPATARPSSSVDEVGGGSDIRVAVLPFGARGGTDADGLAEGITDDLTTALSRFPYLQLVSRGAVRGLGRDAHDAGARLGARFVLEGVVRASSGTVRVSAHLSDTHSGAHVWAETFERDLSSGAFAVQDDIVGRIAATVADGSGALVRALARRIHGRPIATLDVSELVLRYHGDFAEHFDAADHLALRDAFEAAVVREPEAAPAWACLSTLYAIEIFFGLNPKPDPLGRLRDAAARANRLDPDHLQGWVGLATAALFDRDRVALQTATDRIVALNPFHPRSLATLGLYTVFSGETRRGVALVERAIALNPKYPGWYLLAPFLAEYERGDFEAALRTAKAIGMPQFVAGHLAAAAAAGQVGTMDDAKPALEALARFDRRLIEPEGAREVWSRWIWNASTVDTLVEGLVKARALPIPPPASA